MVDDFESPAGARPDADPYLSAVRPETEDDGRGGLALAGGLVAGLVGGVIWATIVRVTQLEIGWAAWGVGGLVGLVMGRITVRRSAGLGVAAAGLAVVGLMAGKLMISLGGVGPMSVQLGAWDLLWFGLALVTAHRLMAGAAREVVGSGV